MNVGLMAVLLSLIALMIVGVFLSSSTLIGITVVTFIAIAVGIGVGKLESHIKH